MQILGLEKQCFSYFCPKLPKMFPKKKSGSDPDARDKERRREENCRKYATEMNNEGEDSRAKGKRHFQSAKLGGYKKGNAE